MTSTTLIGFRANWERLLAERGIAIDDHTLRFLSGDTPEAQTTTRPTGHRHKTALTRYTLSKPVKTLLEYGQLPRGSTLFDYGCGRGADIRGLRELGYQADGWDPVHAPDVERHEADVVNLGYVLNVIEDPAERLSTLAHAWALAKRLLVVSAMVRGDSETRNSVGFQDGVLTSRNTFQKVL